MKIMGFTIDFYTKIVFAAYAHDLGNHLRSSLAMAYLYKDASHGSISMGGSSIEGTLMAPKIGKISEHCGKKKKVFWGTSSHPEKNMCRPRSPTPNKPGKAPGFVAGVIR